MKNVRVSLLAFVLLVAACASSVAPANELVDTIHSDIIHSDLPLFDTEADGVWPRPFSNGDAFGCASRIPFGDWRRTGSDGREDGWYRTRNYGVFHCWAMVGISNRQEGLDRVDLKPSLFIQLETIEVAGERRELWAVQIGARPGSDYVLLSRSARSSEVEAFDVLQVRCPASNVRDGGSIDILITRYCAINDRSELTLLARQMALLPVAGTLELVSGDDD